MSEVEAMKSIFKNLLSKKAYKKYKISYFFDFASGSCLWSGNELTKKNEEKLSRTQELNTAKVLALKELGYTEINEHNASEVFDKIAEIQSRGIY